MTRNRALSLASFLLLAAPLALAQPQAPGGPNPNPGPPTSQRHMDRSSGHDGGMGRDGGMGIVPPGTWWKNPAIITSLSLTPDQQKRLDSIFLESRISLVHLHASLEEEQLKLEPLLNVNPPDQGRTLAQISKIADLRADLEKANAKMLLSLRSVLTADQWTKFQADKQAHHDDRHRGPGGPQGPGGQPGPNGQRGPNPPPPSE